MTSGATWSMCFSVDPKLGMVLSDIAFAPPASEPIKLISSMSLAQLEVPYDDGGRSTSDITTAGFGGPNMHSLTEIECVGELKKHPIPTIGDGTKFGTIEERPVLCGDMVDAGLSYRSAEVGELLAKRKDDWQLSTISKVGWYEYINQITFGADGTIRPSLGATGDLSPADYSDAEHGSRCWRRRARPCLQPLAQCGLENRLGPGRGNRAEDRAVRLQANRQGREAFTDR
ncbi:hypothetical protein AAHB37_18285 [Glutamicibacter halophytocola]|uniref:copper amine oxidase n=1 Tax=Glutamicibacter halophytocola TaxID=1933880 RepID=UPI00321C00A9